jgi:arabinogalactan endo-1,4-beta-galactosidase
VAVHFTNPEKPGAYEFYGQQLNKYGVDYDVFASSYYPQWHGSLENLQKVLTGIHKTYGKQVMVAETAHPYTAEDLDFHGNTVTADSVTPYPKTPEGQAAWVKAVAETVFQIPGGMGVFYWEGTWISAGGSSYEENKKLWETYGSGWASSFATEYDPNDAGKYYGGSAVDNQAMFDADGKPTYEWHHTPAVIEGERVSFSLPEGAMGYYATLEWRSGGKRLSVSTVYREKSY